MAEPLSDEDLSDSLAIDEDGNSTEPEEEDDEEEDEDEDEEEDEGSIANQRHPQQQQRRQLHSQAQQQQPLPPLYHTGGKGDLAAGQQQHKHTHGLAYSQREEEDDDDEQGEQEEDDYEDNDNDEEDDDEDVDDGFESPEKPEHLKDYDPAEPLALEDLMMEKEEELPTDHLQTDDGAPPPIMTTDVAGDKVEIEAGLLDFPKRPPEEDDGTPEEQAEFVKELENFFLERKMEYKHPKFYKENLNCLKLWRTVVRLGGYERVTARKLWRQVGDTFKPPRSCTTISWSFRQFYKKALLDYERFKLHGIHPNSRQSDTQCKGGADDISNSDQLNSSQPGFITKSGRARRDAASRAMQGWHSQRILANGEIGDPVVKQERTSSSGAKRTKQLKMGVMKRKKSTNFERGVQAARARPQFVNANKAKDDGWEQVGNQAFCNSKKSTKQEHSKQGWAGINTFTGVDIWVTDEGPQADWVKINVHKTHDCFEVYALVPGLLLEERRRLWIHKCTLRRLFPLWLFTSEALFSSSLVRVQCEPGGQLVIAGEPEQANNPWGVTAFRKVVNLASPIDASQTSAVFTRHGQLFVRIPFGQVEGGYSNLKIVGG